MSNENSNNKSAFRQIMKGTAIFGGTQFITMVTNIVRGKFVAVILGAYGMGISSLLTSAIQPIIQFFSFGLPVSSVSNIANTDDEEEKKQRAIAFRRCLTIMALAGFVFTFMSSSMFAEITSGKDSVFFNQGTRVSHWFMALSFVVLFTMLSSGENAILQSYRSLTKLAKCNIVGPLMGLVLGVPMYYVYGIPGIVYAMIVLSFITWVYTRWNTRSLNICGKQDWNTTFMYCKDMLMLGGTMMISGLLGNVTIYLVNAFINKNGGASDVGFYQAANSITTQCTAMIFTALATDYFPHLTQVSSSRESMKQLINQEAEIVFLITAPIAATLIVFSPLVVKILLTSEFDCVIPIIQMMSIAFLMRSYYFPLDYICLAKQDKKFFFWMEGIWTNIKMIVLFIGGYWLFGLIGLGYSALLNAVIDVIVSTVLIKWRYGIIYEVKMFRLSGLLLILTALVLASCLQIQNEIFKYLLSGIITLLIIVYSVVQLNKRISFVEIVKHRLEKN